jgi:hypothetical protein
MKKLLFILILSGLSLNLFASEEFLEKFNTTASTLNKYASSVTLSAMKERDNQGNELDTVCKEAVSTAGKVVSMDDLEKVIILENNIDKTISSIEHKRKKLIDFFAALNDIYDKTCASNRASECSDAHSTLNSTTFSVLEATTAIDSYISDLRTYSEEVEKFISTIEY